MSCWFDSESILLLRPSAKLILRAAGMNREAEFLEADVVFAGAASIDESKGVAIAQPCIRNSTPIIARE